MTGDRSLEEFASAESPASEAETTADREEVDDAVAADAADDDADIEEDLADDEDDDLVVEPAQVTHDWSPDGADCAACGETVTRRWRAGDETVAADVADDRADLVCDDCKVW